MAVSPDHKWLAVGSHDNIIYVYNIENKFKLHSKCKGHSSYINSLDWSADSNYLRSTSGAHDLLFWNMPQGTQDVYGRQTARSVRWATKHAKKGWHIEGIYPANEDKT